MKTIKIGGNDYKFEYTIEASLYPECSKIIMDIFVGYGKTQGYAETNNVDEMFNELVKSVSEIPQKALSLFHAGLLEHHDLSEEESKALLKDYIKESGKSFSDILNELMGIVGEDNFFELIGVDKMFEPEKNGKEKKTRKKNTVVGENMSNE